VNFRCFVFATVGFLALFICLGSPAAAAAENWTGVRTRNFFLIGDADEKDIRKTAMRLEQFRETFRLLFPQIKLDGGIKTNVVVFKNSVSYRPFKPKRPDGSIDDAVAGYFQPGEDVNYITLSVGDKSNSYSTIFHEYVHFLLDRNIGRSDLPPWLNEGLAEYYETLHVIDNQRISLGGPPNGHLLLLRQNELISFKTFFAIDNSSLHRNGDESRSLFYAQAWAMVHYLFHTGKGANENQFNRFLALIAKKEAPESAFQQAFQTDYAALEKALRKYIEQPALSSTVVTLSQKLAFETSLTATSLPEAQTAAYLGDLLYHTGNVAEAENFLRKALALDGNLSIANASLGLVLAQQKKFSEAKKHLEKAIAADRTNHFARFNYAYAISRESMDEFDNLSEFPPEAFRRMRDALQETISINPTFAESYRLLAFINMVNDGELDESVELVKKGLALQPGNQEFNLLLAQIFLRQEKYEEAKAIAQKIAKTSADAQIWSEAQDILSTVRQYFAVKASGEREADGAKIFGPLPPRILKRSSLSDADVVRIDEERKVTNLNIFLEKPRFGEKQVIGYVERISCMDGEINYAVRSTDDSFIIMSYDFAGLRLNVLTEGEESFRLDCGAGFDKKLAAMTFRPFAGSKPNIRGQLTSLTFVPDFFRLKTAEEMANRRTVIIEDDRRFTSGAGETALPGGPEKKSPR